MTKKRPWTRTVSPDASPHPRPSTDVGGTRMSEEEAHAPTDALTSHEPGVWCLLVSAVGAH